MSDQDSEKLRKIESELKRRTTNRFLVLWFGGLFILASTVEKYFPEDVLTALFVGGWVVPFIAWMIAKNI